MPDALDVLAIFAHPDDAELVCGGALIKSADAGERTGVLDLTRGETGSRGTPELRAREAAAAAEIMGLAVRRNAELPDARLANGHDARVRVATLIRELRPRIVATHWIHGRHPDHRIAAELVHDACDGASCAFGDSERLQEGDCHLAADARQVDPGFDRGAKRRS